MAAAVVISINRYHHRFVRSDQDLVGLLPLKGTTIFFANVAGLRQNGYLTLLEGAKQKQESEYRQFVRETDFDYTRDLNALAGAANDQQVFFALSGNFHWSNLQAYALKRGGTCQGGMCEIATSIPGRMVSMRPIQSDVIALAISRDREAAKMIGLQRRESTATSTAPLWVRPSGRLLADPAELPPSLRIFAISLQSAESALLSVQPSDTEGGAFAIALDALFRNKPAAETARTQLVLNTDALKLALARQHRKPDPADFSWLLTSGSFQVSQQHLLGLWTVRKELLASLQ